MNGDLDQSATPLLDALQASANRASAAFHTPGHKKGQGTPPRLQALLGSSALRADLPELPELDNLFTPEGVIAQAQQLAAAAFGAEQTWFLANGSTCGIQAAVLAVCNPGDQLVLPRNVHQSAIAALILTGVMPVFVEPEYDAEWDLAQGIDPAQLEAVLAQHPAASAVLIVSPTYHGVCSPVAAIGQIAHRHGIPLLVDEAHGAHFAFHPDLPLPALVAGADLVVQSTHKTLVALTQAAMLHGQGSRVNRDRLHRALQLVQSTSPNYLLLASLDAARQQMATQGQMLLQSALDRADYARTQISRLPGLTVLSAPAASPGFAALDRTRLTVDVTGLGYTGFQADDCLHQQWGVTAELPTLRHLTFLITPGNPQADLERLVQAFAALAAHPGPPLPPVSLPPLRCPPLPAMTPRQAFFAPSRMLPAEQAIGQISTELVCPYPPGIPVLVPGEVITREAIDYLQHVFQAGSQVTGCSDPTLQTLVVVSNP